MGFLSKLFGNKSTRDNKALQPLLQKTLEAYEKIKDLDIDSLRHKTVEFKEYIQRQVLINWLTGADQAADTRCSSC